MIRSISGPYKSAVTAFSVGANANVADIEPGQQAGERRCFDRRADPVVCGVKHVSHFRYSPNYRHHGACTECSDGPNSGLMHCSKFCEIKTKKSAVRQHPGWRISRNVSSVYNRWNIAGEDAVSTYCFDRLMFDARPPPAAFAYKWQKISNQFSREVRARSRIR